MVEKYLWSTARGDDDAQRFVRLSGGKIANLRGVLLCDSTTIRPCRAYRNAPMS